MLLKRTLIAVGIALAAGIGFLLTLPTAEACRASRRVVDPTQRHCVAETGSVELREHILGHALDPVICAPTMLLVVAGLWFARRADRRKMDGRSA